MALLLPHNKFWLKIERLLKPLGINLARWIKGSGASGSGVSPFKHFEERTLYEMRDGEVHTLNFNVAHRLLRNDSIREVAPGEYQITEFGKAIAGKKAFIPDTVDDRVYFSEDEVDRIRRLLRLPNGGLAVCPHCGEDLLIKKVVDLEPGLWDVRCARCERRVFLSGLDF